MIMIAIIIVIIIISSSNNSNIIIIIIVIKASWLPGAATARRTAPTASWPSGESARRNRILYYNILCYYII